MRVGIVGAGTIARVHLLALEELPSVDVVGALDVAPRSLHFRGRPLRTFTALGDMEAAGLDLYIVGTPSPSHAAIVRQLMEHTAARILVEKPLATLAADAASFAPSDLEGRVDVMVHAACAPEVEWAVVRFDEWAPRLGTLIHFEASFADPYRATRFDEAMRVEKGGSWIDSGINAMSVLNRFATLTSVDMFRRVPGAFSTFDARVSATCNNQQRPGRIHTSWDVTQPTKSTRLTMEGGTLIMDHQAVAARLVVDELTADMFVMDRDTDRLLSHYRNLFRRHIIDEAPIWTAGDCLRVHRLLLNQVATLDPSELP